MCLCCAKHRDWNLHIEVVSEEGKIERHPYHVEVESDPKEVCCCWCDNGVHMLRVNSEEFDQRLYDNPCFPLCCNGGDFEWQESGHYFRLELPSLFIHDGLYVDGREVKSRRLNTAEWKCQFGVWLALGTILIVLGATFIILYESKCCWNGYLYLGISSCVVGTLTLIPGILGCYKASRLRRLYQRVQALQGKERNDNLTRL